MIRNFARETKNKMLKNKNHIYCVNVFSVWANGHVDDGKCCGWYNNFEDAECCVLNNEYDIYDSGTYNMVLIEGVDEGVNINKGIEHWYDVKFDGKKYLVTPANKPEQLKHINFFSFH